MGFNYYSFMHAFVSLLTVSNLASATQEANFMALILNTKNK